MKSSSALQAAVEEAYRVFGHHGAPPFTLDVCLFCCVSTDVEKQLRSWPLKRLTAAHFHEYNCSAKSEVQSVREIGHFLPRMLELLTEGEAIHHSLELFLDRVGSCPSEDWRADERAALDRFALAYFDCVLTDDSSASPWGDDAFSVLLMFDIAGISIEPLLVRWLNCDAPRATAAFVEATYRHFWSHQAYENAFASDRPGFCACLRDWILAPEHRRRFTGKLMAPDFQALVSEQGPAGNVPFSLMVEATFDQLTSTPW